MKRYSIFFICFFIAGNMFAQTNISPVKEVNPFIGSVNCRWFFFTPASLPFGMAKLGPHTNAHYSNEQGWEPVGYDYRDTSIEGFGQFHEFQIGGIVLMPITGNLVTIPGDTGRLFTKGYRSSFDKSTEKAMPGYYSVFLKKYGIKAELTATKRVGVHRYTFPANKPSYIIIDVGNRQGESGPVLEAGAKKINDAEIEGYIITQPVYVKNWDSSNVVKMFFVAQFNKPIKDVGSFIRDSILPHQTQINGVGCGMYVSFENAANKPVEVKVGLSYINTANAKLNLEKETANLNFDDCKNAAIKTWNDELSKITIKGGTKDDREKFYTGLFHALSGRGISSDINGQYVKIGGGVGQIPLDKNGLPSYNHFNTDATWGSFWNLLQLWGLAYPEVLSDFIKSHLDFYRDNGWLPDGVAAGAYSPGMPSNFLGLFIASAYNRGIRDFDVETAYEAALKNELEWRGRSLGVGKYDLEDFVTKGYIPIEHTSTSGFKFSASHTLEYAYSSWAVGQMAKALGKQKDYEQLNKLGLAYRMLFDPNYKMVRAKDNNGEFVKDFTLMQVWNGFQEGNSWQYSWYVPQDVQGLINIMGKKTFNERLDSIFAQSEKSQFGGGKVINSFAGLESIYNHGNEPCLHMAYLFNFSGKPYLTQKWVRKIMDVFYGNDPMHGYGYGQDEDQGQLGAWYVLAAIGLFDVQGGAAAKPTVQISSALFDDITIKLNPKYYTGKSFIIQTKNNSKQNYYIQSAMFNSEPLNKPWIYYSDITKGGKLLYTLGNNSNTSWGTKDGDAPPANY